MPGQSGKHMVSSNPESLPQPKVVDFTNTEIAFSHKSDAELKRTAWLFGLMNKAWLVKTGSKVGLWLNRSGIQVFNPVIKATIFRQFCGGINLKDAEGAIEHLLKRNTYSVLDYGAEAKSNEEDFNKTLAENLKAVSFASRHDGVPVVSSKVTALAAEPILEKNQSGQPMTEEEKQAFDRVRQRMDKLSRAAWENKVAVFFDAEETWIQDSIDQLVREMMARYNKERAVVYHTYQLYRKDKLASLKEDHAEAKAKGYILGAKLVRGAYMEKERRRAAEMGYPTPIQETKADTDRDYDEAVRYCVDHYEEIALCNASHNLQSNLLQAELIAEKGLPRNHPHLNFCQLYGMSDYITFNLAQAGYNVAKYVVYGAVKEVVPYLIRRAQENTSVTGEMSRELSLISSEIKRRGLK